MCALEKFSVKRMRDVRDENNLIQSDVMKIEKVTKAIAKDLHEDEKLWVKEQNILHGEKLKRDAEKVNYNLFYAPSLLTKYKHGGPFMLEGNQR